MEGLLFGGFIFFEWVICVPLSFVFCGPFLRNSESRIAIIAWFGAIEAVIISVFYLTTPEYQFAIVLVTACLLISGLLGLIAAKFGWHLGPKSKKLLESVAGFWWRIFQGLD
jgi:hypothetical protein